MEKKRKLKGWVKVTLKVMAIILVITVIVLFIKQGREVNKQKEAAMVEQYITCLEDNWTQRDYCAREMGQSYIIMDQTIAKYGYSYQQVGYDLYIVKED